MQKYKKSQNTKISLHLFHCNACKQASPHVNDLPRSTLPALPFSLMLLLHWAANILTVHRDTMYFMLLEMIHRNVLHCTKCKKDALHKIQNSAFFNAAQKGNAMLKCNIYAPQMPKMHNIPNSDLSNTALH